MGSASPARGGPAFHPLARYFLSQVDALPFHLRRARCHPANSLNGIWGIALEARRHGYSTERRRPPFR